ncbi:SU10 major capsid protein [Streptomyces sp. NPDC055815]
MASITGMGTSFNLPNYAGELFSLTPADTPLLSAIGGLTGGGMTSSTEFEWQTYGLRDPSQTTRVEGAPAPTATNQDRQKVRNVAQIHQSTVSVSYTKQATAGMLTTPGAAPFRGVDGSNPVTNELDWQVAQELKSIALDVNWSFINGQFANPTTNATARKTRGLLAAVTTNRISKAAAVTGATSATDTITSTAHGLVDGDKIVFRDTSTATGIVAGRTYYVDQIDVNTFKVSASLGGAPLTLGTATGISYVKPTTVATTTSDIDNLLQLAYDNGGISTQDTAVIIANSSQKRGITRAYADAYGKSVLITEGNRNVGGVSVDTIETDFGRLGIMMDRHMPQDTICVASLEQLRPVFLNVPGKGVFFEEPLAKTGASDEVQLYGEIGLEYGNERAHAVMNGLAL